MHEGDTRSYAVSPSEVDSCRAYRWPISASGVAQVGCSEEGARSATGAAYPVAAVREDRAFGLGVMIGAGFSTLSGTNCQISPS